MDRRDYRFRNQAQRERFCLMSCGLVARFSEPERRAIWQMLNTEFLGRERPIFGEESYGLRKTGRRKD